MVTFVTNEATIFVVIFNHFCLIFQLTTFVAETQPVLSHYLAHKFWALGVLVAHVWGTSAPSPPKKKNLPTTLFTDVFPNMDYYFIPNDLF